MPRRGKIFVISAPSGTGKTTVVNALIEQFGGYFNISRVITYTTKKPHETEKQGVDYYFVSEKEFEKKAADDFFIECSRAYDDYYGSPRSIINDLDLGKSYIMVLDQVGGYNIIKMFPESVLIWLSPADFSILQRRLSGRARDSVDTIEKRMMRAKEEVRNELMRAIYKYHIINESSLVAMRKVLKILKKELFY